MKNKRIKFRYWDTKYKKKSEMVYDIEMCYDWEDAIVDQEHLMQFTGLKDKKNNDIYESDLLKSSPESTEIYTVYWEADEGRWNLKDKSGEEYDNGDWYVGLFYRCWKNFEVVGNIYENQDLLK